MSVSVTVSSVDKRSSDLRIDSCQLNLAPPVSFSIAVGMFDAEGRCRNQLAVGWGSCGEDGGGAEVSSLHQQAGNGESPRGSQERHLRLRKPVLSLAFRLVRRGRV